VRAFFISSFIYFTKANFDCQKFYNMYMFSFLSYVMSNQKKVMIISQTKTMDSYALLLIACFILSF